MKKKIKKYTPLEPSRDEMINREVQRMRHRELQTACVLRGMLPKEVLNSGTPELINWFHKNYDAGQQPTLVAEFDAYVEEELKQKGYQKGDPLMSPRLRLGYVNIDKLSDEQYRKIKTRPQPTPAKEIKETKPKRERDESTGVYKGTMKDLTYQCCTEKKTKAETLEIVLSKFPHAKEKSITIWYKRREKEL